MFSFAFGQHWKDDGEYFSVLVDMLPFPTQMVLGHQTWNSSGRRS